MIVAGIDPGNRYVGVAVLDCSTAGTIERIHLGIIQGEAPLRKSKKNPNPPPPRSEWVRNRETAALAIETIYSASSDFGGEPIAIGIESAAFSKFGRQDTLAASRQAVFDLLVNRHGNPDKVAALLRLVGSMQAKRALTGYGKADKQRMREAAGPFIQRRDPAAFRAWDAFGDQEKEATADALGMALFLQQTLIVAGGA